jgi:hypothetical protein
LLQRRIPPLQFHVAGLASVNPVIAFIEIRNPDEARSLFFFYILVIAALLWALFFLMLGIHLRVCLFMFIITTGIPAILYVAEKKKGFQSQ